MKTSKIFIAMTLLAALLSIAMPCARAEDNKNEFWAEPETKRPYMPPELTEQAIDKILARIAEKDPQEAEELADLRKENPEEFQDTIRDYLRQQMVEHMENRRAGHRREQKMYPGRSPREPEQEHERMQSRMKQRFEEHLEWFEKNYPDQAKELKELKETNPELYFRKIALNIKKYRRIEEAQKENPAFAALLKEDYELKETRDNILLQLSKTDDAKEKEKFKNQLREVISKRYDLIVKKKQMAYESLLKRLEELKKEVEKNEAEVQKWKDPDFKTENIDARLDELLSDIKEFKWD